MKYLGTAPTDPRDLVTKAYADALTGGGGGGDVSLAANQTFTGNNTFTGDVTVQQAWDNFSVVNTLSDQYSGAVLKFFNNAATMTGVAGVAISSGISDAVASTAYFTIDKVDRTGAFVATLVQFDLGASNSLNLYGRINMQSSKIVNLADGVDATDAVNKGQLDAAVAGGGGAVDLSAVDQNVIPDAGFSRELGSVTKPWNYLYAWNIRAAGWYMSGNGTPYTTQLIPNPAATADQSLTFPAATTGTLATEAYVLANSGGGGGGSTQVFVQQTDPGGTGPAVWYVTDGSGNVIGKKVRSA